MTSMWHHVGFLVAGTALLALHAKGAGPVQFEGSCAGDTDAESCKSSRSGDHLLLQLGGSRLSSMGVAKGPQNVGDGGCKGMPDVKARCSSDSCRVLADDMVGLSCDEYCARSGRRCTSAWEEVNNDCQEKLPLRCDQSYGFTSDLLCMCAPAVVGLIHRSMAVLHRTLVWADEFDGNQVDRSRWQVIVEGGGFGNGELQHYTDRSENVQVKDGVLRITGKCEWYGSERFTSGKLVTMNRATITVGHRVEVRAKLPTGRGTWPAIWMLPEREEIYGEWPRGGEIDIVETVGCNPNHILGTVHTSAYNHMRNSQAYGGTHTNVAEWHTYAMQWEEDGLQWFLDDELFATFAPTHRNRERWPFNQEFYLILNLAIGGSWGGMCLHGWPSCDPGSDFANGQVMEVDFARVYRISYS